MPAGYEIYEEPNGKVYARKKVTTLITPEEIAVVNDGMLRFCEIEDFKLDVKKESVDIYTNENGKLESIVPVQKWHYGTQLRFRLVDSEARIFTVERFCYLGSIDDWIDLDSSADLGELVHEYAPHLGKASFYELM